MRCQYLSILLEVYIAQRNSKNNSVRYFLLPQFSHIAEWQYVGTTRIITFITRINKTHLGHVRVQSTRYAYIQVLDYRTGIITSWH